MKLYLINNGIYHICNADTTNLFSEYWLDKTTGLFNCIRVISYPEASGKCKVLFPELLSFGCKLEKYKYERSPTGHYYVVGNVYSCKYTPEYEKYSVILYETLFS